MTKVTLKGENHTSENDMDEEKTLLSEGVDLLIVEGAEDSSEQGSWLSLPLWFFRLFGDAFYTDKSELLDIAEERSVSVKHTRSTDLTLIEHAHPLVELFAWLIFTVSAGLSIVLAPTSWYTGPLILFGGSLGAILFLRGMNMSYNEGEQNPDERISNMINAASQRYDNVLVIVGGDHVDGIKKELREDIDVTVERPAHSRLHISNLIPRLDKFFVWASVMFTSHKLLFSAFILVSNAL
jgi:hypothetical protein